ncbi:MAG: S8 family serine peptidase [Angustibacter sp.]
MDPALRALMAAGQPDEEVALLVRLAGPDTAVPAGVDLVSRFGAVVTVRAPRRAVAGLRADPAVRSVKAPRHYGLDRPEGNRPEGAGTGDGRSQNLAGSARPVVRDQRRPQRAPTGRGVVVAVVDWGFDLTHPALRRPDGGTRVLALWDQQPGPDPLRPNRFGYGRIHYRALLDAALAGGDPTLALGYDPTASDAGEGCHGTATASVAAGSPWPGGVPGVAPEADLVLVHLSTWGPSGPADIGDSVALAEAVDFVREVAADRPWVLNLSMGAHHGPHDGTLLVERVLDRVVAERPGRVVVQSCGNYHSRRIHAAGTLRTGQTVRLPLLVPAGTAGPHEVDVWYPGTDRVDVGIRAPDGRRVLAGPGRERSLTTPARSDPPIAVVRHRVRDPGNGCNHAVVQLPDPAPGRWSVSLTARDAPDGRYHAWVARRLVPGGQPRFDDATADERSVTGTISNGLRTISVGAYDAHPTGRPLAPFSSGGPTVDGRARPHLLAPGADVLVARSRPVGWAGEPPSSTRMSGTSLAAPHVAGAVACLLQQAGPLPAGRVLAALTASCQPYDGPDPGRAGYGYLDVEALLTAHHQPAEDTMRTGPSPVGPGPVGPGPVGPGHSEPEHSEPEPVEPAPAEAVPVAQLTPARGTIITGPPPMPPRPTITDQLPTRPPSSTPPRPSAPVGQPLDPQIRDLLDPLLDRPSPLPVDPSVVDPAMVDPAMVDPAMADPSAVAPAAVDVAVPAVGGGRAGPGDVLRDLDVTAAHLFDAYVLRRRPDLVDRLGARVAVVGEPLGPVGQPQAGDLLVRGQAGEGQALVSSVVDGDLVDLATVARRGWAAEGDLPGRYALVLDAGPGTGPSAEPLARRITDQQGWLPPDQAVLRASWAPADTPVAPPAATPADAPPVVPVTAEATSRPRVPVRKDKEYVRWYQQALNDLDGARLVPDGVSGPLTKAAVRRFQTGHPPLTVDGLVGPQTEACLIAAGAPAPPGGASPLPPGATPCAAPPVPVVPQPPPSPTALDELVARYLPPTGPTPTRDVAPVVRTLAADVRPLVDGAAYFSEVRSAIDGLRRGQVCYIASWKFCAGFDLEDGGPPLGERLLRKAEEGVDVRLLVWASKAALNLDAANLLSDQDRKDNAWVLAVVRENVQQVEALRARVMPDHPLAGRVLLDWSGNNASSHHMKAVVVGDADDPVAFVGGLDFAERRFDQPPHPRGWHDAGVRVGGRLASRVLATLRSRWSEAATLSPATHTVLGGERRYNPPPQALAPLPAPRPAPDRLEPTAPDVAAQVLRTFPTVKEFRDLTALARREVPSPPVRWSDAATFPPGGVHEVRQTLRAALTGASRYVYIEDQTFDATRTLFPLLVAACARGVRVAVVVPQEPDPIENKDVTINQTLSAAVQTGIVDQLAEGDRQNLAVWRRRGAYVHTKVVLVDDAFACIGSANFQDRSLELVRHIRRVQVPVGGTAVSLPANVPIEEIDSELSVAAVTTGDLVRDLRVRLWSDHLDADPAQHPQLRDLSAGLGVWRPSWGTASASSYPRSRLTLVGP